MTALEDALGLNYEAPIELCLTRQEYKFFGLLMKRDLVLVESMVDAIYGGLPQEERGSNVISVFIFKLRTKLKPFGIKIVNRSGQGFLIPHEDKQKVLQLNKARGVA